MKKFLMVLLSIAFVLNLAIVIGLIGGYGSPRRALYTITDELMNSAYRKYAGLKGIAFENCDRTIDFFGGHYDI